MDEKRANILEMLLKPEIPNVMRQLPEKQIKVKRLSELLGAEFTMTLRGLPYGKVEELRESGSQDMGVHILLAGVVEPNLKDQRLKEKFGGATPAETVKAIFLPGEIEDISRAIERLCGYRMTTIEEIKNV